VVGFLSGGRVFVRPLNREIELNFETVWLTIRKKNQKKQMDRLEGLALPVSS
jgi:hypothetical protein